jgi:hypothetical protein
VPWQIVSLRSGSAWQGEYSAIPCSLFSLLLRQLLLAVKKLITEQDISAVLMHQFSLEHRS